MVSKLPIIFKRTRTCAARALAPRELSATRDRWLLPKLTCWACTLQAAATLGYGQACEAGRRTAPPREIGGRLRRCRRGTPQTDDEPLFLHIIRNLETMHD